MLLNQANSASIQVGRAITFVMWGTLIAILTCLNFKSPSPAFELKTLIQLLIQWIVVTDQPFTTIEHPLFKAILSYLHPELSDAKGFSDNSVHWQIMLNFAQERQKVIDIMKVRCMTWFFRNCIFTEKCTWTHFCGDCFQSIDSKISYTTDVWTATNFLAFMGITAHWITADMEQKHVTLDFIPLVGRHTGQNLGDYFVQSIQEMNTLEKVSLRKIFRTELLIGLTLRLAFYGSHLVWQLMLAPIISQCPHRYITEQQASTSHGMPLPITSFVVLMLWTQLYKKSSRLP